MRIDTYIVYHAQRIITEIKRPSLKTEGSWASKGYSSHTDLASRVGVGSLLKQTVVGVVQ